MVGICLVVIMVVLVLFIKMVWDIFDDFGVSFVDVDLLVNFLIEIIECLWVVNIKVVDVFVIFGCEVVVFVFVLMVSFD